MIFNAPQHSLLTLPLSISLSLNPLVVYSPYVTQPHGLRTSAIQREIIIIMIIIKEMYIFKYLSLEKESSHRYHGKGGGDDDDDIELLVSL